MGRFLVFMDVPIPRSPRLPHSKAHWTCVSCEKIAVHAWTSRRLDRSSANDSPQQHGKRQFFTHSFQRGLHIMIIYVQVFLWPRASQQAEDAMDDLSPEANIRNHSTADRWMRQTLATTHPAILRYPARTVILCSQFSTTMWPLWDSASCWIMLIYLAIHWRNTLVMNAIETSVKCYALQKNICVFHTCIYIYIQRHTVLYIYP